MDDGIKLIRKYSKNQQPDFSFTFYSAVFYSYFRWRRNSSQHDYRTDFYCWWNNFTTSEVETHQKNIKCTHESAILLTTFSALPLPGQCRVMAFFYGVSFFLLAALVIRAELKRKEQEGLIKAVEKNQRQ